MARYIPNNSITRALTQNVPSPITEDISMLSKRVMRFKVISDRYTRGFEKADVDGPQNAYENSGISIFANENTLRENKLNKDRTRFNQIEGPNNSNYTFETPNLREQENKVVDNISIVDIDFTDKHINTRGYSYITLPFIPLELSYEPASKFVGIATIGRNNPHYMFTGSEDTLQFDIDWFSNQENRQDVINSCRWVEALTKSDGYRESPHRVKLVWGKNDLLWQDTIWLVVSAPYRLRDFVKAKRDFNGNPELLGLMPQQATQSITLKKLTDHNLLSSEVIGKLANNIEYGK